MSDIFSYKPKIPCWVWSGMCIPWPTGQKWPGRWCFVARSKVQILKQALQLLEGIAILSWVASRVV